MEEVVVERMRHVSKSKSSTDVEELNINQVSNEKEYIFPPVNLLAIQNPDHQKRSCHREKYKGNGYEIAEYPGKLWCSCYHNQCQL